MANVMFAAPYQDLKARIKRGSLGDLNPVPWAMMLGNCMGWLGYSFLIEDYFLYFANGPPLILAIWYNLVATKLQFAQVRAQRQMRKSFATYYQTSVRRMSMRALAVTEEDDQNPMDTAMNWARSVVHKMVSPDDKPAQSRQEKLVVGVVFVWVALFTVVGLGDFSSKANEYIIGIAVNCNLVFFFAAPLSTIFHVLRERNSASIHIRTMVTNTVNGTFWTAYGLAVLDPFVYVPNGMGVFLGAIQIFLVLTFPRKAKDDEEEVLEVLESTKVEDGNSEHSAVRSSGNTSNSSRVRFHGFSFFPDSVRSSGTPTTSHASTNGRPSLISHLPSHHNMRSATFEDEPIEVEYEC